MAARWVRVLLALQECDLRIRDLETRLASIPGEMLNLKARRDKAAADTAAAAEAARVFERAAKRAESEIARLNLESDKLRQQSAMVKKNNEYQAMLNTVEQNRKKISDLESEVIENLDRFEAGKKSYREVKAANEAIAKAARAEFEELGSFANEVKEELAKVKATRPKLQAEIDADMLNGYTQLLNGKNSGAPLVKVDENGVCGHCHMKITPQAAASIHKGAITRCDNCQHFIWSEDSLA